MFDLENRVGRLIYFILSFSVVVFGYGLNVSRCILKFFRMCSIVILILLVLIMFVVLLYIVKLVRFFREKLVLWVC